MSYTRYILMQNASKKTHKGFFNLYLKSLNAKTDIRQFKIIVKVTCPSSYRTKQNRFNDTSLVRKQGIFLKLL